jgi:hypothetical protein
MYLSLLTQLLIQMITMCFEITVCLDPFKYKLQLAVEFHDGKKIHLDAVLSADSSPTS